MGGSLDETIGWGLRGERRDRIALCVVLVLAKTKQDMPTSDGSQRTKRRFNGLDGLSRMKIHDHAFEPDFRPNRKRRAKTKDHDPNAEFHRTLYNRR